MYGIMFSYASYVCLIFSSIFMCLPIPSDSYKRVCYYTNWAQYRTGAAKFLPEDVDPSLCSHVIYAFAKMEGNTLAPFEWNDADTDWSIGMYSRTMALKEKSPGLKVMLAVGGWNFGTKIMVNKLFG